MQRIQVKWPNDIYYGSIKLGGVLVKSTILGRALHAIVGELSPLVLLYCYCTAGCHGYLTAGIGVNVSNSKPTIHINDVINDYNNRHSANIAPISVEVIAARVCTETEYLIGT